MQKQEFFVPGPLPGLNEIIAASKIVGLTKSCRRIPGINYSKMKAKWTEFVVLMIKANHIKPIQACEMHCTWIETNRKRDPDNIKAGAKFIWDGLVKAGILENDGWNQNRGEQNQYIVDPKNPGVKVILISD